MVIVKQNEILELISPNDSHRRSLFSFKKFTLPLLECQITHLGVITHRLKITALEAKSEIALSTILPF